MACGSWLLYNQRDRGSFGELDIMAIKMNLPSCLQGLQLDKVRKLRVSRTVCTICGKIGFGHYALTSPWKPINPIDWDIETRKRFNVCKKCLAK